ncbi:hypothetical protein [Glaciimonas soli]|uniref:Uncharacterized protein n=1 Tax=Glaciimonas soli TaxID=2590999 RepID=A0A843YIB9_9BURK|nr:hypothetical protein [Glaciimonas soli]MQQ99094.1 hypothetical protein [Glaciimonas soli]
MLITAPAIYAQSAATSNEPTVTQSGTSSTTVEKKNDDVAAPPTAVAVTPTVSDESASTPEPTKSAPVVEDGRDISDIANAVVTHYPAGSIHSVETADQALAEVSSAKSYIEAQSFDEQRVCYSKFFTNNCLDVAKTKRRLALKKVRPVEVEANAFKRRTTADDRDKALAAQNTQEAIDAPKKAQEAKDKAESNVKQLQDMQQKDKEVIANTKLHAGDADKRVADQAAKVRAQQQSDAAKAPQRAANVAAYNKKAQDAAARQREVAQKKAEKERDLAAKKAAADAAAASAPATPVVPAKP